jgi:hypothetical protein
MDIHNYFHLGDKQINFKGPYITEAHVKIMWFENCKIAINVEHTSQTY